MDEHEHQAADQRPTAPGPPPPEAWQRPVRVEPVPGTPYGLAILGAPEATSGAAVGALVAGIAAAVMAAIVTCVALAGASAGWGAWVGGAFAALAGFLSVAAVGLGAVALRQMRGRQRANAAWQVRGRGMALAGPICGAAALLVTGCAIAGAIAIQLA